MFFIGSCFSIFHGVYHLYYPGEFEMLPVALSMLGLNFCIESFTFYNGLKAVRQGAKECGMKVWEFIKKGPDPMGTPFSPRYIRLLTDQGVAVIMEDGAALVGITLGFACIAASYVTGNPVFDAVGSILIGTLLGVSRPSSSLSCSAMAVLKLEQMPMTPFFLLLSFA